MVNVNCCWILTTKYIHSSRVTLHFIVSVSHLKVSRLYDLSSLSPCVKQIGQKIWAFPNLKEKPDLKLSIFCLFLQDKTWLRVGRRRRVAAWALRSGVSFPCTCQLLTVDSNTAECRAIKLRQCHCQHCWGNCWGAGWGAGGGLWSAWGSTRNEGKQNMIIKWETTPACLSEK